MIEKKEILKFQIYFYFIILALSGAVSEVFNRYSDYYYYYLAGRENCNTGIAPCGIGFSEKIDIMAAGWIISLLIILLFLIFNRVKRKWLIFGIGIIFLIFISITAFNMDTGIFNLYFKTAAIYVFSFGLQYIIFSKILK
jgi:hypothetical protein